MTVNLHRDPVQAGWAPVEQLPQYVRPLAPGRYWHQPRSASIGPAGELSVVYWCGQHVRATRRDFTDSVPEELRCGTCVGRRLGFDGAEGAVFSPRDHWRLPTRCPGRTWGEDGLCLACGNKVKAKAGPWASGMATHRPGEGLAQRWEPCPFHGWRDAYERGRGLSCGWGCGWSFEPRTDDEATA